MLLTRNSLGSIDVSRLESSQEDADFDPRWTVLYIGPRSIAPESSWSANIRAAWLDERARWLYIPPAADLNHQSTRGQGVCSYLCGLTRLVVLSPFCFSRSHFWLLQAF
jgi:hypothetical protein